MQKRTLGRTGHESTVVTFGATVPGYRHLNDRFR